MKQISLTLPGQQEASPFPSLRPELANGSLGDIISQFLVLIIYIAGFISVAWFAWGAFEYIFAGGNKEGLGKAKKRMTWSIIGFILVIFSFAVTQYVQTIFPTRSGSIQNVSQPDDIILKDTTPKP
jgi:hypothetical protein